MEIEIKNKSGRVIHQLMQGDMPDGVTIEKVIPPSLQYNGSIDWTTLVLSLIASVPTGIFVNWLSNKLLDKTTTKIIVNRKEIYYNEGDITRIIEETRIIEQGKINNK
jgi:hypothetical protein